MNLCSPEKYNRRYGPKTPFLYIKVAITFFSIGSLRSPENRDLPYDLLNNCAKFDLNLKIFFELSRGGGATILNPVHPRLSSGDIKI